MWGIAFNSRNEILVEFFKSKNGDSLLVAEIIAIEEKIDMALNKSKKKACFFSDTKTCIDSISDTQHNGPWQIHAPLL